MARDVNYIYSFLGKSRFILNTISLFGNVSRSKSIILPWAIVMVLKWMIPSPEF